MLKLIARLFYRLTGWTYDDQPEIWESKQVIVGFPHTTNMDGVRSLALFRIYDIPVSTLVKSELFTGPMGWLLRSMGCIPVERKRKSNLVTDLKQRFESEDHLSLLMAPEGSRNINQNVAPPIKTGFWHIARTAGVPIILMMSDSTQKRGRILGKLHPSDSIAQDLLQIRDVYAKAGVAITLPEEILNASDDLSMAA